MSSAVLSTSANVTVQATDDAPIPFVAAPIAACFSKAAGTYVAAARLQRHVATTALHTLLGLQAEPGHVLDLGCGPGWIQPELLLHAKSLTAIDLSEGMLAQAARQGLPAQYLLADAAALPLADNSVDSVFSSLMLQWCQTPAMVLAEVARVLKPGGHAVVTTLLAGTLTELEQAFARVDSATHIHPFLSETVLINACQTTLFEWQHHTYCYQLPYPDIFALARELKALGANHVAQRAHAGLTGKGYWQKVAAAYPRHAQQPLYASYQVAQLILSKTV